MRSDGPTSRTSSSPPSRASTAAASTRSEAFTVSPPTTISPSGSRRSWARKPSSHASGSLSPIPNASASARCSRAGHLAEGVGLGTEVPARLLGRHPGAQQVAQGRVRQVPGVGRPQHVLAHDGQVGALVAQLGQLGHDVGEAPLAQHVGDLDVRVALGMDPAEQLEDQALVVHHRSVGLLHHQRPGHLGRLVRRHPLQHHQRQVGVDQRVVPQQAVDLAHGDPLLALEEVGLAPHRAAPEHHLVGGAPARGIHGLDQVPDQCGIPLAAVEGGHRHRGGRLVACVPPLPGQELTQQRSQLLGQIVEAWHLTCLALVTDDGNAR